MPAQSACSQLAQYLSKAPPFDPSLPIYVVSVPPGAMDDLGTIIQAVGRIRRAVQMSFKIAIVVFSAQSAARSAEAGPPPPGFGTNAGCPLHLSATTYR